VLAREDARFYQHGGIDWRGILRALVRDVLSASAKEGASSITQQLARNSLPLGGRTISRKLLEAMVALRIERQFTKQQILELYINRIYFGAGCYGVETASQAYFGKSASKLNLPEAALLAGLIRSPNRFSPFKILRAQPQRNAVLIGWSGWETFAGRSGAGKERENHSASQTFALYPGKLCDGCRATRFEPGLDSGPDRQRRPLYLYNARSDRAKCGAAGARDSTHEN
jgi:membrane carboxypeptidase/penicillin-binding protein PbpC